MASQGAQRMDEASQGAQRMDRAESATPNLRKNGAIRQISEKGSRPVKWLLALKFVNRRYFTAHPS